VLKFYIICVKQDIHIFSCSLHVCIQLLVNLLIVLHLLILDL
jgi:hypothetical protein